jgi:hypothetical protein
MLYNELEIIIDSLKLAIQGIKEADLRLKDNILTNLKSAKDLVSDSLNMLKEEIENERNL